MSTRRQERGFSRIAVVALAWCAATPAWAAAAVKSADPMDPPVNLIVTSESSAVKRIGQFHVIEGYLSRSPRVFRSVGNKAHARITPSLPLSGSYEVYAWWPQMAPGAGTIDVTILDASGSTRLALDQKQKGGQWVAIGLFEHQARKPLVVTLRGSSGTPVIVDALRFERTGSRRPELEIEPARLPAGEVNMDYRAELSANGRPPYHWSLHSGDMPDGFSLDSTTGVVSGRPADPVRTQFVVEVRDASGQRTQRQMQLEILGSEN